MLSLRPGARCIHTYMCTMYHNTMQGLIQEAVEGGGLCTGLQMHPHILPHIVQ
jgi:hypothetical protein